MTIELQRAGMWKRISALILDFILLCIVSTGFLFIISYVVGYDSANDTFKQNYDEYMKRYDYFEKTYDVDFDITREQYDALPEEVKEKYSAAEEAIVNDEEMNRLKQACDQAYKIVINLTVLMTSLGIFIACLLLEFAVPLLLKDGQTVGKKIFGLCVVGSNAVRVRPTILFIRAILGKYTIEIMVPVLIFLMIFFSDIGMIGLAVLGLTLILQVAVYMGTRNNSAIHDLLAGTVVVEGASQRIFNTREEMMEYEKKEAEYRALRGDD